MFPTYRNPSNTDLIDYKGTGVQLLWQLMSFKVD